MLLNERMQQIVAREVDSLGYTLWGIEMVPTRYSYLVRVYIDGPKGVGIEDCSLVNRHLDMCLKKEDYLFEVSSPGLARKFFKLNQYRDYIGEEIRIRVHASINGQKNFSGKLVSVEQNSLRLQMEDKTMEIAYSHIERGQLQPDYAGIFK